MLSAFVASIGILGSNFALADEWREIHDLGNRKLYLSFPQPSPSESPILVWSMISFKQPQITDGKEWSSWVQLEEFDCKKRERTLKKVIFYPVKMAKGQPLQSIAPETTEHVQPSTLGAVVFDLKCKS